MFLVFRFLACPPPSCWAVAIVHFHGLRMKAKQRVHVIKKVEDMTWHQIASHPKVKNLRGEPLY